MDTQLKKGMLDACVLSVLSRGEAYGYQIAQNAMPIMNVSESTLYPVLRRLEGQGFLATRNEEYNGRLRKYYKITPEGEKKLERFKTEWLEAKRIIDYILCEEDVR